MLDRADDGHFGSIPRQTAAQGATRPNHTRTTPEPHPNQSRTTPEPHPNHTRTTPKTTPEPIPNHTRTNPLLQSHANLAVISYVLMIWVHMHNVSCHRNEFSNVTEHVSYREQIASVSQSQQGGRGLDGRIISTQPLGHVPDPPVSDCPARPLAEVRRRRSARRRACKYNTQHGQPAYKSHAAHANMNCKLNRGHMCDNGSSARCRKLP